MKKVNIKKYLDLHFKEVSEPLQIGIYQYTTRMDHSRKNIVVRILKREI